MEKCHGSDRLNRSPGHEAHHNRQSGHVGLISHKLPLELHNGA